MKRNAALFFSLIVAVSLLTACGPVDEGIEQAGSSQSTSEDTSPNDDKADNDRQDNDEAEQTDNRQSVVESICDSTRPEAVSVTLSAVCEEDISQHVAIDNIYHTDYLHNGVVGLVGVPIEVSFPDDLLTDIELTFEYDKDELRGVPERNLIVLTYNVNHYDECEFTLNTEESTASLPIVKSGVFLLVDAFEWFKVWGDSRYLNYAYTVDKSEYKTDWELECDTGSIMKIADIEWAMDNAPYFDVSTPEQLAGVVYYVNGVAENRSVHITLQDDIDLSGLEWVPMGWYSGSKHSFTGIFDGNGHTISHMTISEDADYPSKGFIGYSTDAVVSDITFTDAVVAGGNYTGVVGGQIYVSEAWENIHLIDCLVDGAYSDYGAIVGRESGGIGFRNCSLKNVMVNGTLTEYYSYRQQQVAETEVVETFSLTMDENFVLYRDQHAGFENLGWCLEIDGVHQLTRLALNETQFDASEFLSQPGSHTVYLQALVDGMYVRVSNLITFAN